MRRVEFWWSRLAGFTLPKQTALAPTLVQPLHSRPELRSLRTNCKGIPSTFYIPYNYSACTTM